MYYLMVKTVYDVFSSSDAKGRKDRGTDGRRDRLIRNAFCNGVAQQRCRLSGVNTSCYRCDAVSGVCLQRRLRQYCCRVQAFVLRLCDGQTDAVTRRGAGRLCSSQCLLITRPSVRPSVTRHHSAPLGPWLGARVLVLSCSSRSALLCSAPRLQSAFDTARLSRIGVTTTGRPTRIVSEAYFDRTAEDQPTPS